MGGAAAAPGVTLSAVTPDGLEVGHRTVDPPLPLWKSNLMGAELVGATARFDTLTVTCWTMPAGHDGRGHGRR